MDAFMTSVIKLAAKFGFALLFNFVVVWLMNATFSPAFLTFVFGVSYLTFWKTFIVYLTISTLFKSRIETQIVKAENKTGENK